MTLHQLRHVIRVASTGSINKAAKLLGISQPTLTDSIKKLERELDITIFERQPSGVHLTQEGTEFLDYARDIIRRTNQVENLYRQRKWLKESSVNGKMTFFTRLHISVLKELQQNGRYIMKREYLERKNDMLTDYYATLYEWFTKQARKHISIPKDCKYPIWLMPNMDSYQKPVKDTVVLELEIPIGNYLITNHNCWCYRMNYFYIPLNDEDEQAHQKELERFHIDSEDSLTTTDKGNFYPLLRQKITASWDRVFTIPPETPEDTQGSCWEIKKEWMVRALLYDRNEE